MAEPAVEADLADVMLVAERDRLLEDDSLLVDIRTPVQKLVNAGPGGREHDEADDGGPREGIRGLMEYLGQGRTILAAPLPA